MACITVTSEDSARRLSEFRIHTWISTETLDAMYGVQVKVEKRRWAHVVAEGRPVMFPTKAEANAKIATYKGAA